MKLYVVRHGQTDWNKESKVQGKTDIPLNEEGIKEAQELKELVCKLNLDLVITSPLKRALETAKILTDNKVKIITDDRIIERDWGLNEGKLLQEVDRVKCWNVYLNIDENNIEKVQDFLSRISLFLEDIINKYPDKNILIVAHSAVSRAIHYLIEKIPIDGDLTLMNIPNLQILEYKI